LTGEAVARLFGEDIEVAKIKQYEIPTNTPEGKLTIARDRAHKKEMKIFANSALFPYGAKLSITFEDD
jgi:hypothetical protein